MKEFSANWWRRRDSWFPIEVLKALRGFQEYMRLDDTRAVPRAGPTMSGIVNPFTAFGTLERPDEIALGVHVCARDAGQPGSAFALHAVLAHYAYSDCQSPACSNA